MLQLIGPAGGTVILTGAVVPAGLTADPTTAEQIVVGFGGAAGALEVNADAAGNGFTVVTGEALDPVGALVGSGSGSMGTVTVSGDGAGAGATFRTSGAVVLGASGGEGTLAVSGGGRVFTTFTVGAGSSPVQAGAASSSGTITVDGAGSLLESAGHIQIGAFADAGGSITVSGGGVARTTQTIDGDPVAMGVAEIGTGSNATGSAIVTGADSSFLTNGLIVGNSAVGSAMPNTGTLTVEAGAAAAARTVPLGPDIVKGGGVHVGSGSAAGSQITVTGPGSSLTVEPITFGVNAGKEILVGGLGKGGMLVDDGAAVHAGGAQVVVGGGIDGTQFDPGILTVRNGATLTAAGVTVNANGTLAGDGTVTGNVTLNGGTIAPGTSPGTLIIVGDLLLFSGVLDIEVGALVSDRLAVSGAVEVGTGVVFNLIFDFDPAGMTIDLADLFTGYTTLAFEPGFDLATNLAVSGLPAGAAVTVALGDAERSFREPAAVPAPGTLSLVVVAGGFAALAAVRRRRAP